MRFISDFEIALTPEELHMQADSARWVHETAQTFSCLTATIAKSYGFGMSCFSRGIPKMSPGLPALLCPLPDRRHPRLNLVLIYTTGLHVDFRKPLGGRTFWHGGL